MLCIVQASLTLPSLNHDSSETEGAARAIKHRFTVTFSVESYSNGCNRYGFSREFGNKV